MQLHFLRCLLLTAFACFGISLYADQKEKKPMMDSSKNARIAVVRTNRIFGLNKNGNIDPELLPQASHEWRVLFEKLQETLAPARKN